MRVCDVLLVYTFYKHALKQVDGETAKQLRLWISKTRMTTIIKPVYVYSLHEIVYVKKYAHLQGLFQTVFGRLL